MAVKKNIEDSQGKDNYPCGQQLLIHNGKVLKDETSLVENKVTEEGFLVVMLSKSKSGGSAGQASVQVIYLFLIFSHHWLILMILSVSDFFCFTACFRYHIFD
jgi:uncharacterized membrane protein YozB (DUF420 family)